ncbi:LysR family transcriptional regulator [Polaromonas sp. P1-6]|nr:LysR family transcriptional regulator [Polaromonas sp. P1-6]
MDLTDIRIALVVARTGSLSAASEKLGITQPTLSKAIARLERESKIRLFERLARGMRPTELGQTFLSYAERLDLNATDLYAALRDLRQAKAGTLRLGIGQGVPDRYVISLAEATTAHGVTLDLSGGMTDSLQKAVAVGDLEFALIGLARAPSNGLKWIPIRDDPMQPMAPRSNSLTHRRESVAWSELSHARWIVPAPGTASFAEFERNFCDHRVEPPIPIVASRASTREVALAVALDAIVLITRSLAEDSQISARFRLVRPEGGWASKRKLVLVHRQGGYLSPSARKALETIRETVASS